jgi:hypothetical protein
MLPRASLATWTAATEQAGCRVVGFVIFADNDLARIALIYQKIKP